MSKILKVLILSVLLHWNTSITNINQPPAEVTQLFSTDLQPKETYETKQHLQFCHENNNLEFSPSHVVLSKHRSVVMDVSREIQSKIIK